MKSNYNSLRRSQELIFLIMILLPVIMLVVMFAGMGSMAKFQLKHNPNAFKPKQTLNITMKDGKKVSTEGVLKYTYKDGALTVTTETGTIVYNKGDVISFDVKSPAKAQTIVDIRKAKDMKKGKSGPEKDPVD